MAPLSIREGGRYVNVGCGSRYHRDWTNLDIVPAGEGVTACDLTKGIPLADDSCDAVYHSHVLEHVRRADAPAFVGECFRVLKPGGVLRIAVPDLEQITRIYLSKLEAALDGDEAAAVDHEWMVIEIYDQTVRERTGGGMLEWLARDPIPNETFVYERIGEEGRGLVSMLRERRLLRPSPTNTGSIVRSVARGLRKRLRKAIAGTERSAESRLSPEDRRALDIGRFRLAGEVHQWMYDRFSLGRLLLESGFVEPTQRTASESWIPGWTSFELDVRGDGTINKPESLFMEARKPTRTN